jgi:hypothetical protein
LVCPAGQDVCGDVCCSPDRQCDEGLGECQCKTPCGFVCCLAGQVCLNENTGACGCDGGSCPAPCACDDSVGGAEFCYTGDILSCDDLQPCGSNFDCPPGSACSFTCDGAVCVPFCQAN